MSAFSNVIEINMALVNNILFQLAPYGHKIFLHARFILNLIFSDGGGGVDPIPCVSTHRISDPRSGPAQLLPPHVKQRSHPTGSVHKSQTVSVVGMSGQLKRCNESWFGSLQSGQFAAGWLAGSILCR